MDILSWTWKSVQTWGPEFIGSVSSGLTRPNIQIPRDRVVFLEWISSQLYLRVCDSYIIWMSYKLKLSTYSNETLTHVLVTSSEGSVGEYQSQKLCNCENRTRMRTSHLEPLSVILMVVLRSVVAVATVAAPMTKGNHWMSTIISLFSHHQLEWMTNLGPYWAHTKTYERYSNSVCMSMVGGNSCIMRMKP